MRAYRANLGAKVNGVLILLLALVAVVSTSWAEEMVTLAGNHPPAITEFAAGALPASGTQQLHIVIALKLANRVELDRLLSHLHNPSSPNYHRWLSPQEFHRRFDPAAAGIAAVVAWLSRQGFQSIVQEGSFIRFLGSVAQVEDAFQTQIVARPDLGLYSNLTDPKLPLHVIGVVGAIMGLDNLHAVLPAIGHHSRLPDPEAVPSRFGVDSRLVLSVPSSRANLQSPKYPSGGRDAFGPDDLRSLYDENPLLARGLDGAGTDCGAIVGDSDFLNAAVTSFNDTFALPQTSYTREFPDGTNPGRTPDEVEALLDIEWFHAVAPGSPVRMYIGDSRFATNTGSGITDALQEAVNDNACPTISISFGFCGEPDNFYAVVVDTLDMQAVSQGQSVFVASGDDGAAQLVFSLGPPPRCVPGATARASEFAADPNVTAVGGTQFTATYDSDGEFVSATPEEAWDDGDVATGGGATGGGVSEIFPQPAYQGGLGIPGEARGIPDIAAGADWFHSPGFWITVGVGTTPTLQVNGGTSLSTPVWAGIARILVQRLGRLGNLNPELYRLGRLGDTSKSGLRDVLTGNNDFNGVEGFTAGPGYDLTTGWGTPDMAILAEAFHGRAPTPTPTHTRTAKPTATRKITPRPTRTVRTPTRSATRTHTRTVTRTPSPTHTPVRTSTRTPAHTATHTVNATRTATRTPTRTAAHTSTRSPSRTPTPKRTATPRTTPTRAV